MKVQLLWIGKTDNAHVAALCEDYAQRLSHLLPLDIITLPEPKNTRSLSAQQQNEQEGEQILRRLQPSDRLFLFDERGRQFSSPQLADWLQRQLLASSGALVLAIGGPYGFSPQVYARANGMLSLSALTFSHQLVRAICLEQLYRACAINHHLPYHHGG